jgi:hypothetical protein
MVIWPCEGAHGSAMDSEEEESVVRLAPTVRCGSDRLNRGMKRWRTWWRDELGRDGVRRVNWSSSYPQRRWHWANGKEKEVALLWLR